MADEPQAELREIPIEFYGFYDIPATYTDLAVVSNTQNEFTLYFFQSEPPFQTEQAQLLPTDKARAKCVARIIIPHIQMELLVGALQTNLARYKARLQQELKRLQELQQQQQRQLEEAKGK